MPNGHPQQSARPAASPAPAPKPEAAKPEAAKSEPPLPIGAKPTDPKDPQAAKFDPKSVPPLWNDPKKAKEARPAPEWNIKPAIDPLAEKPPAGFTGDGMTIADEQRARSAWIEAHGMAAYEKEVDDRPDDERPTFDPHALAGGGAFVTAGAQKQVPGVTPPTKRS
jgi:hypothetical protein